MSLRTNFRKDVEEILAENISAKEKLEKLDDYLNKVNTFVAHEKVNIKKEYTYCPKCKDYYKNEYFKKFEREEIRSVRTNPWTGGYLDPYEYEDTKMYIKYEECPKGHLNEIDFT